MEYTPARTRQYRSMIFGCVVGALMWTGIMTIIPLPADSLSAQITPIDEEPDADAPGLGNIVGSPEAGPDPQDAGDRGGWAQLALAGVIVGGVAFIGSRITAESRRLRSGNISDDEAL